MVAVVVGRRAHGGRRMEIDCDWELRIILCNRGWGKIIRIEVERTEGSESPSTGTLYGMSPKITAPNGTALRLPQRTHSPWHWSRPRPPVLQANGRDL